RGPLSRPSARSARDDVAVPVPRVLACPFLRGVVHVDEAEAFGVAGRPLEVVHRRPYVVAAHVPSRGDRVGDRVQVRAQVVDPPVVDAIAAGVDVRGYYVW